MAEAKSEVTNVSEVGGKGLAKVLQLSKSIRVCGFDDGPHEKVRGSAVPVYGTICSDTKMEGMLYTTIERDGLDATDKLIEIVKNSKFYQQLHLVIFNGNTFGGFNFVDLQAFHEKTELPCAAVMRKSPDQERIRKALHKVFPNDCLLRILCMEKAGEVYHSDPFYFQVKGASPEVMGKVLKKLTDQGNYPECLRLSHLIGSAIKFGESSNRA